MRTLNGETLLTLKEASEKFNVPTYWFRRQVGKPRLPGGKIVRSIKFPADVNHYMYLSELEQLAKPLVFNAEYVESSQKAYDLNPNTQDNNVPDFEWNQGGTTDEEPKK